MDFSNSRYYCINRYFLSAIGLWPDREPIVHNITHYVHCVIVLSFPFTLIVKSIVAEEFVKTVSEIVLLCMIDFNAITKMYSCSIRANKLREMVEHMKRDWLREKTKEEEEIMIRYAERGRMFTIGYALNVYSITVLYCLLPISPAIFKVSSPINEARAQSLEYNAYYSINTSYSFYSFWINQIAVSFSTMTILVAIDTMFMVYATHACGLFAIAGHRYEHVFDHIEENKEKTTYPQLNDIIVDLIYCIRSHVEAIQFTEFIEGTFRLTFLYQFIIDIICLSLALLQITFAIDDFGETIRHTCFIARQVFHMFCNNYSPEEITQHSLDITHKMYYAAWYNAPVEAQKMLITIIARSQKPCVVTAGGYYILCLENFFMIVQISISYFTILSTFI